MARHGETSRDRSISLTRRPGDFHRPGEFGGVGHGDLCAHVLRRGIPVSGGEAKPLKARLNVSRPAAESGLLQGGVVHIESPGR